MTLVQYNRLCAGLPHTTHVVQWGGAHVWKVGGKVFAIAWPESGGPRVTFKCSALSYELLKEQEGCRPAPYLAARGMVWIQRTSARALSDRGLKGYIKESHRLAAMNLTKKARKELGLE